MDGLGNGEGVLMEGAGKHVKARLSLSKGVACELFFTLTAKKPLVPVLVPGSTPGISLVWNVAWTSREGESKASQVFLICNQLTYGGHDG